MRWGKEESINQAHTGCRKYLSSIFLKTEAKSVESSATEGLDNSHEVGITTTTKIFLWCFSASGPLFS